MINSRNSRSAPESAAARAATLGMRPLSTRSLLLSVLLGSHPPRLPLSSLTGFCGLFGVRAGTVRTALSRLAAADEVIAVTRPDGSAAYELAGALLDRQQQQDAGRLVAAATWDGDWITAVVMAESRPVAERRRFRSRMLGAKMGELRPDVWMRPANLGAPAADAGLIVTTGQLAGPDAADLAARLWDLRAIDGRSATLLDELVADNGTDLGTTFVVLAAVLNHLRTEPQLPPEIAPSSGVGDELRAAYRAAEQRFQRVLAEFLDDPH